MQHCSETVPSRQMEWGSALFRNSSLKTDGVGFQHTCAVHGLDVAFTGFGEEHFISSIIWHPSPADMVVLAVGIGNMALFPACLYGKSIRRASFHFVKEKTRKMALGHSRLQSFEILPLCSPCSPPFGPPACGSSRTSALHAKKKKMLANFKIYSAKTTRVGVRHRAELPGPDREVRV